MSEQERQAWVTSLRLLAVSPKSRKALQKKLEQKGYSSEVIEKTLDQLERQGAMNDRLFAQALFQTFTTQRPSGRRRIAFELKKRGISSRLIQELLEQYPPEEERLRAFEIARLRQERWKKLDPLKRRKRIYDFLVRKGFDFSLSRGIADEIESEKP